MGNAFRVILNNQHLASDPLQREKRTKTDRGDYFEFTDLVRKPSSGQELPVVSLFPKQVQWNKQVVVWVDGIGKAGLYDETEKPRAPIQALLKGGAAVIAADLIYQGEFLVDGKLESVNDIRYTGVMEYRDGKWLIVQFHCSVGVAGQVIEY